MGFIYKLNFPSGKSYIGQTTQSIETRIKAHRQKSSGCILVSKAIQKYPDFEIEILLEINNELLSEYEIKFIKLYDTVSPNGYNLTHGGEGGIPSEETKAKMRESHKDRVVHDDWRQKISEGLMGHVHSEETKKKLSDARLKNPTIISDETRHKMRDSLKSDKVRDQMSSSHRKYNKDKEIPRYIHKVNKKKCSGYVVRIPGKSEKIFTSSQLTDEEKLVLAIDFINNLNEEGSTTK